MSIRILHAADLHMDSPFDGLSDTLAAQRRREQRELLGRIVQAANEEKVDLVLFAGDLFDSDSAYKETKSALEQALREISVPVLIAPGNHDCFGLHSPYASMELPDNVYVFHSSTISGVELPDLNVRVWGAAFTERNVDDLLSGFEISKRAGTVDVLLLHADAMNPASPYCPVSESDIARSGADYAAFGHIHSFSGLKKAGGTYYAWPGCPEGRGFDETGEKGVIIADVDCGRCELRFLPLAKRKYRIFRVDLTGTENALSAVTAALPEDTHSDVCRIVLSGETESAPDTEALYSALSERFFTLSLRDETVLRRDIWEQCGEDSLRGLFLERLRSLYDGAETDERRAAVARAVRWGLAAMDGGEEPR